MKPRIWVVDDDEDDLWLIQKAMVQVGGTCQISPFSDASSVLRYLDTMRGAGTPGLILIDYHLPRMNGQELTEGLRAKPALRAIPVAWMSSEIDPSWEEPCQKLNVSWCWVKPTNYPAWQTFVRQICGVLAA